MAFGIHIDVRPLARIGLVGDAVKAGRQEGGLHQIRVGGAIREAEFEATRIRCAHHVSAIVARPGDSIWRPGRTRSGDWCVDPLIAVHRRVGQCTQALRVMEHTAEKMVCQAG